ncbi:hypothetical protein [Brevibacillus choshinensis]|nr:hypothetical protein [Brevibacillus choshinensis]
MNEKLRLVEEGAASIEDYIFIKLMKVGVSLNACVNGFRFFNKRAAFL